jgi:L-amino acid N-acyltransferase YncA
MSVTIRLATPEDAEGILAIYGPFCELSPVSFEIIAPSFKKMRARIEKIGAQYPWLICEIDGEVAGYVYASQHRERAAYRWNVDVAAYVAANHRRRRVAQALYATLFSILRGQGYFKAFAGITLPNEASVGLHESMGFKPIAVYRAVGYKLGRWLDVGWWQFDLQPEVNEPPEPLLITAIRDDGALTDMLAAGQDLVRPAAHA